MDHHLCEHAAISQQTPKLILRKPPNPKPVSEYRLMEERIKEAIADYETDKYKSLAGAGRAHGITKTTGYHRLRARAGGRVSKSHRLNNGSRLDSTQQAALCRFIENLEDDIAIQQKICEKAHSILCENKPADDPIPRPFERRWACRFLKRHPWKQPSHSRTANQRSTEGSSEDANDRSHEQDFSLVDTPNGTPQLLTDCQMYLDGSATESRNASEEPAINTSAVATVNHPAPISLEALKFDRYYEL